MTLKIFMSEVVEEYSFFNYQVDFHVLSPLGICFKELLIQDAQ
jgi:hypothetical protein